MENISKMNAQALMDTIDRLSQSADKGICLKQQLKDKLFGPKQYIDKNGQDLTEILNWRWSAGRIVDDARIYGKS